MSISRRELVFLGITLGILCAAWFLVLAPRERAKDRMRSQMHQKQQILDQIDASRFDARKHLEEDLARLDAILDDQASRLPQDEKVEKVFRELSNLAKANELHIQQIRTNDAPSRQLGQEHPTIEEQGYLLELEGSFPRVQAFLDQLEKQPRLLRIDELRIQRTAAKSPDARTVQVNLRFRVFSRKGAETT